MKPSLQPPRHWRLSTSDVLFRPPAGEESCHPGLALATLGVHSNSAAGLLMGPGMDLGPAKGSRIAQRLWDTLGWGALQRLVAALIVRYRSE